MKRSKLIVIKEKLAQKSKNPWACFETSGPTDDGRVEFAISWNTAFIERLKRAGFDATTEEELVQLFFMSARMLPESLLDEDDTVNPEATPRLTSEANVLKR